MVNTLSSRLRPTSESKAIAKSNDRWVTTRSQYVSELGSFTRRKTHALGAHLPPQTLLYYVERRDFVLCGDEKGVSPSGFNVFSLDNDY